MKDNLRSAVTRLAVFVVVCVFGIFALYAVFAQLRFDDATTYNARFSNVSGLTAGQFVRVAGVEVGKVKKVAIEPDATLLVTFSTDNTVVLTQGSRAVIRFDDLIGGRYLALEEGAGDTRRLNQGDTIALGNTAPALDLDALLGGFRPLFRALDPDQVNALSSQLITSLQGEGGNISSFLSQTAALTSTLADRDKLIGDVITNLNTVLVSFGDQSKQLDTAVVALGDLMHGLAERKEAVSDSVAYTDAVSRSLADLLGQARPPAQKVIQETDRTAGIVVADHEYVDNLLATLPDSYRTLNRLGLYGDFFSFYLCDAVLKVNGKGGQPVYIKLAGQSTGRCAPR